MGTIYMCHSNIPIENCKVIYTDTIYEIEKPHLLSNRTKIQQDLMLTETEDRFLALNCLKCRDDDSKNCKECGCSVCGGKHQPEDIVLCDECDLGYHINCLNPALEKIPDDDHWYCPKCKTDVHSIIKKGSVLKQTQRKTKTTKDWGRGMACAGRTKTCTVVPAHHFGAIPGVPVGSCWKYRMQASEAGVHRPPVSGIHGKTTLGAFSIVLAAGYEDDKDDGLHFTYTGAGGRDLSGNKRTSEQNSDQTLTRENEALARCCAAPLNKDGAEAKDWKKGKPVRVLRSEKLKKHNPKYAPEEGIRYDGIYKVVKYWQETGQAGFKVWRYLLKRDDLVPAPWQKGGFTFPITYPDNYLNAQLEKLAQKKRSREIKNDDENGKKKRKVSKVLPTTDLESNIPNETVKIPEHKLTAEQTILVNADTTNSKLWDQCKEQLKEGEQKFISIVQETFTCIICQEVSKAPITTPCLHNMCNVCLKRSFASNVFNCPCCRSDLKDITGDLVVNVCLSKALQCLLSGYDAK